MKPTPRPSRVVRALFLPALGVFLGVVCTGNTADDFWRLQGSLTSAVWAREDAASAIAGSNRETAEKTDVSLYEYGRLSLSRLPSDRKGLAAQFYVSGRWNGSLTEAMPEWRQGDDWRLYEAYLDLSAHPFSRTQLRLGRQTLPNTLGFWQMDGVRFQRRGKFASATVYGGQGAPSWGYDTAKSGVIGAELAYSPLPVSGRDKGGLGIGGRVGTFLATDGLRPKDVHTLYLTAGLDLNSVPRIHRAGRISRSLSADIAYEPMYARLARASLFGRVGTKALFASVIGRYDIPQFPQDSIFRVFAYEATREGTVAVSGFPQRWLSVDWRHTEQWFDDSRARRDRITASLRQGSEPVLTVGVEWLGWEGTRRRFAYFRAQKTLLPGLTVAAGNSLNSYRLADGSDDLFSRSLQGEIRARLNGNVSFLGRVERNTNEDYRQAIRVFGYLQTSFSADVP